MKTMRTLLTVTAAAAVLLLVGCGEDADTMDETVSGEVGQAVEETREATGDVIGAGREALEETGDRIESATD